MLFSALFAPTATQNRLQSTVPSRGLEGVHGP